MTNQVWQKLTRPVFGLSPMADMTDSPFCRLVKRFGADVIFREMVSAEAIVRGNEKTFSMIDFEEAERPNIQQIFGKDPAVAAEAARIIEERYHPDGIDINMGCPVRKMVSDFNGAALMREPELAGRIVRAVKNAVMVPVSVKMRLGWSDPAECLTFAPMIEEAGADLVSVHGRTKAQGYSGRADWGMIARVKARLKIPVLANGDIVSPKDAKQALEITQADGVLVGRGALGRPWALRYMKDFVTAGVLNEEPDYEEKKETTIEHFRLMEKRYGCRAATLFRKHLVWYWKGFPGASELRTRLMKISNSNDLLTAYSDWDSLDKGGVSDKMKQNS
jgi:tRNA-dihydrouridine synthase B